MLATQSTIRVSPFYTFFHKLLVYTIYKVQIGTKPIAKKSFEFFMPGEDFEIFWGVNDVTRKVHILHD